MSDSPSDAPFCLIVDDEPRLRQVLMHLMRSDGFQCMEAANGVEALAKLDLQPVPLVISDIRMPEMDGVELLRQIRMRHPDVAVMMVSAVLEVDNAVQCLSIGAMDYIVKPYQLDEMRARVQKALEKRRLILENRDYRERLEERIRQQNQRLEDLFLAGVQALVELLEKKDAYTRGHSVRVSHYSRVIAQEMGFGDAMLRQVEIGGFVHDIGKVGVRESVLNKNGPLTDDEYKHIMSHPVFGWEILKDLLSDAPHALNIVRSHHERFDGRGGPDGLAGSRIPIEARIAAAADSLDAMTSDRPYRPSEKTLGMAIAELERCSGSQFDPDVVRAVIDCATSGALTLESRLTTVSPAHGTVAVSGAA